MIATLVVVYCGRCGAKIGRIEDDGNEGLLFVGLQGSTRRSDTMSSASAAVIFCSEPAHGYAQDLESPKVLLKALTAKKRGVSTTHRAQCLPRLP